mmetsp:Transcript_20105/g.30235  ORF Transcript_20105/g.30235 Transcript_20105/m.30235 type:complete len:93 (+) Transcript_20105:234-512(+)
MQYQVVARAITYFQLLLVHVIRFVISPTNFIVPRLLSCVENWIVSSSGLRLLYRLQPRQTWVSKLRPVDYHCKKSFFPEIERWNCSGPNDST